MPSQVTVTAMKTGPASAITKVFVGVTDVNYDLVQKNVHLEGGDAGVGIDIDINAATTITHTISSGNHTIAIS